MAEVDAGALAPAETVVTPPAADAVPAPGDPNAQGDASQQADKSVQTPKMYSEEEHRKGISERLTKERRRLERIARAEVERDYYKSLAETRQQPQQQQGKQKPKPEDYAGRGERAWEEYNEALIQYHAERIADERLAKVRDEGQQDRQSREVDEQRREAAKRLMRGAEKYPDFREVVGSDEMHITPPMADAITRVKNPADVAYHLGTHHEEAERIASLSPTEQIWEIKDLSARLSAPPKQTSAPPPIVPNNSQSKVTKDWKDMSTAEHIESWRNRKKR